MRRDTIIHELDNLLTLITRLSRSEPITSAVGAPPAGFASLPLLKSPGYREAYRACLILSLGLRLEGGPVRLSLKDVSQLYEYWCLLALLRIISEETGRPIPVNELLGIEHQGLRVRLERGREHATRFRLSADRAISVAFNPRFPTEITPQQPDIVVTIEDRNWPTVRLVLDAKYRIESSSAYVNMYGSPGPPEDAINVLHRYRDAILEWSGVDLLRPKRTIIQAAALFPYRELEADTFRSTRLWRALHNVGVGAIPFLPSQTDYVREWLRSNIRAGSWTLADRAIDHRSLVKAADWRRAAAEPVLLGVLRAGDEALHLRWIRDNRAYYVPLLRSQREIRQYATRYVAIYSPSALRTPGAVTHLAAVNAVEVLRRDQILTPWPTAGEPDRLHIVFRLDELQVLRRPIVNQDSEGRGERFSTHRWTTKLALDRARYLSELFPETEPEWRLYEQLTATNTPFIVRAGRSRMVAGAHQPGRAWFVAPGGRAQYRGEAGFVILSRGGGDQYYARTAEVAERLQDRH